MSGSNGVCVCNGVVVKTYGEKFLGDVGKFTGPLERPRSFALMALLTSTYFHAGTPGRLPPWLFSRVRPRSSGARPGTVPSRESHGDGDQPLHGVPGPAGDRWPGRRARVRCVHH